MRGTGSAAFIGGTLLAGQAVSGLELQRGMQRHGLRADRACMPHSGVDEHSSDAPATVGSIANTTPVVIGARPGSDWTKGSLDEASIQIG